MPVDLNEGNFDAQRPKPNTTLREVQDGLQLGLYHGQAQQQRDLTVLVQYAGTKQAAILGLAVEGNGHIHVFRAELHRPETKLEPLSLRPGLYTHLMPSKKLNLTLQPPAAAH